MRKKLFPEENKTVIYAPPPSGSKKNEASPSRPWIISTHATALSSGVDPDPNWILIQDLFLARELLTCGMHYTTAPRAQKQYKNSRTC